MHFWKGGYWEATPMLIYFCWLEYTVEVWGQVHNPPQHGSNGVIIWALKLRTTRSLPPAQIWGLSCFGAWGFTHRYVPACVRWISQRPWNVCGGKLPNMRHKAQRKTPFFTISSPSRPEKCDICYPATTRCRGFVVFPDTPAANRSDPRLKHKNVPNFPVCSPLWKQCEDLNSLQPNPVEQIMGGHVGWHGWGVRAKEKRSGSNRERERRPVPLSAGNMNYFPIWCIVLLISLHGWGFR